MINDHLVQHYLIISYYLVGGLLPPSPQQKCLSIGNHRPKMVWLNINKIFLVGLLNPYEKSSSINQPCLKTITSTGPALIVREVSEDSINSLPQAATVPFSARRNAICGSKRSIRYGAWLVHRVARGSAHKKHVN